MVLDRILSQRTPAFVAAESNRTADQTAYIQWPDAYPNRTTMGGKGAALAALNADFAIPDWFVITPAAFQQSLTAEQHARLTADGSLLDLQLAPDVADALGKALAILDTDPAARFAVRSSAITEDGVAASYAGQLASFLWVPREEVSHRIVAVWQSAFAEHVAHYRRQHVAHTEEGDMLQQAPAVIVQRMVDADVAGVAFGADPVTGDRRTATIAAVRGVADQLVSGKVNGDTYVVDRTGLIEHQTLMASMPLLSLRTIQAVTALLNAVEAQVGTPQDIEWALEDGQLVLLQARPITTLGKGEGTSRRKNPSGNLRMGTIWDNSNIVESYSGVTAPLTFSFARHVYEHVYIEFCKLMGVTPIKIKQEEQAFRNLLGYINGHVYYNLLNWYRILALFPGFQMNRRFMEQMMGVKEPLPDDMLDAIVPPQPSRWVRFVDGVRLGRAGLGLVGSQLTLRRTIKHFNQRLDDALTLTQEDMHCLSLPQLVMEYRKVERQLLTQWDAPLINDFLCMIAFGLSRRLLERQAGEAGLQLHSTLLIGQGDIISAEPAQRIRAMAAVAATDEQLVDTLRHGAVADAVPMLARIPELQQAYEDYLAKFGNRCLQELKLESATLHDDPLPLLRAIGQMALRHHAGLPSHKDDGVTGISIHAQLAPFYQKQPLRRWWTGKVVQWAKNRVRDRENLRFERTRVFGYARQLFLAIGAHLQAADLLDQARDIFLLTVDEVLAVIDGAGTTYDLRGLVALRKAERARFTRLPAPPNRFTSVRLVAGMDHQFLITPQAANLTSGEERKGIGCCAGVVRAPVRVITDPRSASLQPGEIMVAQFTDPGWITHFANAGGVLVERGSLLSHSAIVARELGIPAIVAIDGVMDWLQSGDVVEMNGATGCVQRVAAP
ncbi:MAG: PEP/pyruvate-binding domain-containing protein [Caldilineaceae bacterium]